MRYRLYAPLLILPLLALFLYYSQAYRSVLPASWGGQEGPPPERSDWFFEQRAYPRGRVPQSVYRKALDQADLLRRGAHERNSLQWQFAGPVNTGGRISSLAVHPSAPNTIYAGAASGGVFKSTNGGDTWTPVFDDNESLSIGDLAVAPSDPLTLYVGTGEANGGGGSMTYDGYGVYKTTDGGTSWQHVGLETIGNVGRVAIDPADAGRVFVAAMGDLFADTPERGIYRTLDGGQTWEQVLHVSDSTGGVDVVIHPTHSDTVYAALWERIRRPNKRRYGGPTTGIYRTVDGGQTWTKMTAGLPAGPLGRIGLSVTPADPSVVYAVLADVSGGNLGVWKSADHGATWDQVDDGSLTGLGGGFAWWFGKIFADPTDADRVYTQGLYLRKSENGGENWTDVTNGMHVDQHALWINPANPLHLVAGNDGGLYVSTNGGLSWSEKNTLPITQFYTCEVDETAPERLYGGAQDNGTNRTLTGGLNDWMGIFGGDGFVCLVDPSDPQYVYAEYQYGNFARSTDGGSSFAISTNGIASNDRKNWNTPYVIDPHNPQVLYLGTQRLYRSVNRAASWSPVSPDLTNGAGGSGGVIFGTITSVAVSPADGQVLWAGTDDGNVQVSQNGGISWENVAGSLPNRWVTRVVAHPSEAATAYVTLSGYRWHEYQPHVLKTTDYGLTWQDISSNLPEAPVNDLIADPGQSGRLYAATDIGVYVSHNDGVSWEELGDGLPLAPVVDLRLHVPTHKLVAATYGRSMYAVDLTTVSAGEPAGGGALSVRLAPNPLTETGMADVWFGEKADATVEIFDGAGRFVGTVFQGHAAEGRKRLELNRNAFPAPGLYLVRLRQGRSERTEKIMVL
jgi:photosystem II stability/assembly factor-like uncharacterized protein